LKILLDELSHMVIHAENASDTNPQTVKLMVLIQQVITLIFCKYLYFLITVSRTGRRKIPCKKISLIRPVV